MSLERYRKKRNFKKTPEPSGKVSRRKGKKLLFIIQKHAASHLHYDFRLELNGVLLSWAIPKGPCLDPNVKRLAVHVEDHPLAYGSFEGIIPKGQYGSGTVMLWDKGEWICDEDDAANAYQQGHLSFILNAKKLKGRWKLFRINKDDKTWLLVKYDDDYAVSLKQYDITIEEPDSVITHKSMHEITKDSHDIWDTQQKTKRTKQPAYALTNYHLKPAPFPKKISPQLATLVDTPPVGKKWLHEIKFDGYRLLACKQDGRTTLFTRHHLDWTQKFPSVAKAIDKLPVKNAIFDGEVVVLDEKQHANFQLLQQAIKDQDQPFIYYLFDLIYLDEYNLSSLPLIERKKLLKKILPADDETLFYSDHVSGSGKAVFTKSCALGLEGIVSKEADSLYVQKRSKQWLKIKCNKRQAFVIGGFTQPKRGRSYFGALLLGSYNKHQQLIFNGHAGTGFTQASLKSIYAKLKPLETDNMPFHKRPPESKYVTWVEPVLIGDVEFQEWTDEGYLRHPRFKGLHMNKETETHPKQHANVKLTHPDKLFYPEDNITKEAVVEYYQFITEHMMPYVLNRPLTLLRCPDGYQHCFYQKHINESTPPTLHGILIKEKKEKEKCIYIDDEEGLLALPQLGTLEVHTWGSRIEDIEHPDMIVFDLDPAPDVPWQKVVKAALEVRQHLAGFQLKSFVKTTGGKGLHVVVPIKPDYDWVQIKGFAQVFSEFLTLNKPDDYINKMSKAKRKGKIFVDYLRNERGSTAIAPYSTRARIHAPVAVPLHWDELSNDKRDVTFTIKTVPGRIDNMRKDPWQSFFKLHQTLNLPHLDD